MLKTEKYEEVIHIRLSRELDGRALYWTSAFFIDGLLIDTGPSYTAYELADFLSSHPPKMIINTHYHEDHIGANQLLKETFHCPIYAPKAAIPRLSMRPKLYPYQELVWGYPEPSEASPLPPKIHTDLYTFSVISTPGHSKDHVSLVEERKGWYFTGDLFPGERVKTIRKEENIGEILSSLKRLREMKTERMVIFTGTGRIFPEGRKTTEAFITYIQDLKEKVAKDYFAGLKPSQIVEKLFGGEDPRKTLTQDQFSCENLVCALIHLVKGETRNLIEEPG